MKLTIDDLELDESIFHVINQKILKGVDEAFKLHEKKEQTPRYMTKHQACQFMGVSFNTLQKYIHLGLRVVQVDSLTRLDQQDCISFMEQNKI